jgi:protein farnesyltransferase subunit beta
MDIRGCYCSLVVADILNIIEGNEEFTRGVGDFIATCQTYEGGISCAPFGEAHGGYTFCGLAAMILLGEEEKLELPRCLEWLV